MRKLFLLLTAVFAFIACEGPIGPMGPPGEPGGLFTKVEYITIKPSEWKFMGPTDNPNEVYYQCVVVPKFYKEMNKEDLKWLYNDGAIHAYLFHNFNTKEETQTPLPYVVNWTDENNQLCVETDYFDYSERDVAFYIAYSGGNQNSEPNVDMTFRLVANW